MIILLLLGFGGLVFLFLAIITVVLLVRGQLAWNAEIGRAAKTIGLTGFILAVLLLGFFIGVPGLIAIWPYLLVVPIAVLLVYSGLTLLFKKHETTSKSTSAPPIVDTWDSLWRAYENKPLPPWMLEAAMKGDVVYDGGKRATVVNGVLVPKKDSPSLSIEGLFQKLDKFLG